MHCDVGAARVATSESLERCVGTSLIIHTTSALVAPPLERGVNKREGGRVGERGEGMGAGLRREVKKVGRRLAPA